MDVSWLIGCGLRRRHFAIVIAAAAAVLVGCTGEDVGDDPEDAAPADTSTSAETQVAPDDETDAIDDLDLVRDDVLTVCTEASYPPFDYVDEDSPLGYSGFDIELIDAAAATLGLSPVSVVEAGFEDIASGAVFAEAVCDVGASAIVVTAARAERLAFTQPHYVSRRALLTPSGSTIERLEDLERGMVLGVQSGTAAADRAAEEVHEAEIRTFDDGEALYAAITAGELDAALHDNAIAQVWVEQDGDIEVVEEFRRVEEFAFAVARARDDELLALLDRGLVQVREDGTYDELFEVFFGVHD